MHATDRHTRCFGDGSDGYLGGVSLTVLAEVLGDENVRLCSGYLPPGILLSDGQGV